MCHLTVHHMHPRQALTRRFCYPHMTRPSVWEGLIEKYSKCSPTARYHTMESVGRARKSCQEFTDVLPASSFCGVAADRPSC